MEKIEVKRETATQLFYREVAELRPRLPKNWKSRFLLKYPDYDTVRGSHALMNVIAGKSTDQVVLEGIREIVKEFEVEEGSHE